MDIAKFELDADRVRTLEPFGKVPSVALVSQAAPVAFDRDRELAQLERHLLSAAHNSFILVGPSGCGKTAILRELFRRLARRAENPWIVLETSAGFLLAGCSVIGTLERKLRDLVLSCPRGQRIAVYFTDIFAAAEAGRTSKDDMNIADFLTPYVENGDLVLIGECTPEQFRRGIDPHPTFKNLFTAFHLRPLEDRQVKQVIAAVAERTAEQYAAQGLHLHFTAESLAALQEYGRLYYPGVSPPGGALRLMEHMVAQRFSQADGADEELLEERTVYTIRHPDVIQALESFTGIPGLLLDDSRQLALGELRQFFESRVLGQTEAIGTVTDVITLIKAGVTDPSKPMSVLFFVGPTGVGKTELAKALAEYIFGSPDRMIRFDMSEFKDYYSFEKLIGSMGARNGPTHQGSLLSRVRQQPFSLILLDELEKAHENIFDLLLQLFDDGRLSDAQGNTVDFTQTLIVMTSNLGSNLADERTGFGFSTDDEPDDLENRIRTEMSQFFRPEFVNRIDRIVVFQPLKREHMRTLAQRELGQVLLRNGITRRKLRVDVDPGVIDILLQEGFSPLYGARPLKRAVERLALIPIARQIVKLGPEGHGALLRLISVKNRIQVKIVQDRRSRTPDVVTQGVKIVDPVSSRRVRLKPADLDERMQHLTELVQSLEQHCDESKLRERKAVLMQQTSRVDFWDQPDRARAVLGEIYRSERLLDATTVVVERTRKLQDLLANGKRRAEDLSRLAQQIHDMQQHAELLRYSMECQGELEQSGAFLVLSALDEPQEDDLVGKLADMYRQWAEHKGFEVTVLHEELFSPKITRQVAMLIEGVAVYGILQGEGGIHEFFYNRTSQSPRMSRLAKVRVLPAIDDELLKLPASELEISKQKSQGKGLRCKRYNSLVTVTHLPSHVSVTGRSELAASQAAEMLTDWLRAEMHAVRYLESDASSGDHENIRRKYTLRPQQHVKDPQTGVTTRNLGELWQGRGLDEFLYATILQRNGRVPQEA